MTAQLDERGLLALFRDDPRSMDVLRHAASLELPDWWIVAGFVRCLVWDHLHGYDQPTPPGDIDLVYFDPSRPPEDDRALEVELRRRAPAHPWEIYNQAHMHDFNGHAPYTSAVDSFACWAESVSTVGITLRDGEPVLAAPHGIGDLVGMVIRPTPHPGAHRDVFERRLVEKDWRARWPRARVERSPAGSSTPAASATPRRQI